MRYFLVPITVVIIAACIMLYPNPPLSESVLAWQKRGQVFKFKSHDIFYIVENGDVTNGDVLLILHGFPTSSYDWVKIMPGLKKNFQQVVVFDMLGYGFSDKPSSHKYSILEQADISEALLRKLGIEEFHILSHDYGDSVALELLARFNLKESSNEIKSLCLTNGGIFPETYVPKQIQKLLRIPYFGDLLARLIFFKMFKKSFGDIFGPNTQPTELEFKDFYSLYVHKNGHKAAPGLIQYISERSQHKERWVGALQTASIPVHMIYGPADPINPIAFIGHYKKTVPNPSITVLGSDIGHYPQFEDPEAVLKYYTMFLQKIV